MLSSESSNTSGGSPGVASPASLKSEAMDDVLEILIRTGGLYKQIVHNICNYLGNVWVKIIICPKLDMGRDCVRQTVRFSKKRNREIY